MGFPHTEDENTHLCFPAGQAKHFTSAHGAQAILCCINHITNVFCSQLLKYISRKAPQNMKEKTPGKKWKISKSFKAVFCFPLKVNFLILWNYRRVARNAEYWECAIILCKPLTPTHAPFSGSGWLIQVNFRENITLKKYPPSSNSSPLGIGKVLLWSHLARTAKPAFAGTKAESGKESLSQ